MSGKNAPKWTKEQQQVIDLRDRNILVSAAAGSGKTAVLVERIITMITDREHPCDIDRLLVVTFTKAAAAQMRQRIGEALEKRLLEQPQDAHLQKQANLLHTAQIMTIDSFCQNIIRNYFHVIHLDPAFRVGDETELRMMKQEVLEELIEENYARAQEEGDTVFLRFTDIFSPGRSDSALEGLVLQLFEVSNSYPEPEEWLRDCAKMYCLPDEKAMEDSDWGKKLMAYCLECAASFLAMAKKARRICLEEWGPRAYLPAIESDIAYLEKLLQADSYAAFAAMVTAFSPARLAAVRGNKADTEKRDQVKELRSKYLKEGLERLHDRFFFQSPQEMLADMQTMEPFVAELVRLTIDFSEAFAQKKREEGLIDFADMEHFALQILTEKTEDGFRPSRTACDLQEYYQEILTDEYQDSNYVQELLLQSLCRAPKKRPYLFMVGDVKQSIYQFRLARPELFVEKYDTYAVGKGPYQRIDLHRNFRSRALVLEAANDIFERIMKRQLGGVEYDEDARLVPGAAYAESDRRTAAKTELLLTEGKTEDALLGKKSLEAAVIGQKIQELVIGENPMYVWEKDAYRPVRYGDIAILLRSTSGWSEEFIEMLGDMGIPAYSETKTGYFTAPEVETVLNYLAIIDNPRQDIPLAAVLRSAFAGVTDEELAWLGTMPQKANYWDRVLYFVEYSDRASRTDKWRMPEKESAQLQEKLTVFLERLQDYRRFVQTHSVYELLRRIYQETGYYHRMAAMPAGEKRKANLDILLQRSVEFAKNGERSIYGFTRYIEQLQRSEIDFGEAALANENMDAVRIMTIHKSKGLEFPVVFVAGLGKQFNLTDARKGTIISGDYGVGCDYVDLDLRVKQPTLLKRFFANEILLSTLAEEIRILYVALTRAQEQLFLTGTANNLPKRIHDWLTDGSEMDYYQMVSARTYLDWIMAALAGREKIKRAMREYEEQAKDGAVYYRNEEDSLFVLELRAQKEIVAHEKTAGLDAQAQYQYLREFRTDVVYDEQMRAELKRQQDYVYPYRQAAELPVKLSVSELKRRSQEQLARAAEDTEVDFRQSISLLRQDDRENAEHSGNAGEALQEIEIPRPAFLQEETAPTGAARGTLYHLVMEHFPYGQIQKRVQEDGETITAAQWNAFFAEYLTQMTKQGYFTEGERELLRERKFTSFLQSDIGKRMLRAAEQKQLFLEQPFMIGISAQELYKDAPPEEMILVQGIIDAYFFEGDEIILVDYKTDAVSRGKEEILIKRYRTQLDYYAKALEQLVGKKVAQRIIYSFALGKEIDVESISEEV